ncbi:MAG: hypothetical protein ACPGXL_07455 [Chitinophagales bacterium]
MNQILNIVSFSLGLFLFFSVSVQAQDNTVRVIGNKTLQTVEAGQDLEVRITKFRFKKVNEKKQVLGFEQADVLKLEQFFLNQQGVIQCLSDVIDKTFDVTSIVEESFDVEAVVATLFSQGYVTTSMRQGTSTITLKSEDISIVAPAEGIQDCNECGEVEVSEDLSKEFQTMEYGDELINFDFGASDGDGNNRG